MASCSSIRVALLRLCVALGLGACTHARGGDDPGTKPTVSAPTTVEHGAQRIAIDGDPNGLLWDADAHALLIADGDGNRILRWTDAAGITVHTQLPGDPTRGRGLGQLVRLSDGTLVVTRFGDGASGGIVTIAPDGKVATVPGIAPERRRIGLAVGPDDVLFTAWFEKHGDTRVGAIARLELAGRETVVLEGLQKPVGLVVQGDALFIADQRLGQVLRAPLDDLAHPVPLAGSIVEPDLLCLGPAGSLLTGGKNGQVRRIAPDGTVTVVAEGFSAVRGVAYDPAERRLFVAEHDIDDTDGIEHAIHIRPLAAL